MSTKVCSKCGEEKDESEFYIGRNQCKTCRNEQKKKYRIKSRDADIERAKKWRENNKERAKENNKKWRENNKEKVKELNKLWREKNKIRKLEWDRQWREKNKDKTKSSQKKYYENSRDKILNRNHEWLKTNQELHKRSCKNWREKHPEKCRLAAYNWRKLNPELRNKSVIKYNSSPLGKLTSTRSRHKRRALSKESPCTLTLLQWDKILESQGNKCAICGKRFCKSRPPTVDHIIPLSKGGGLTFENVQALCRSCNSSKNARLDHTKIITWCMS
jgi:hypothetical protein